VKSCAEAFAQVLSVIYTQSFQSGKIPKLWKQAQITPIFKKGSRSTVGNYRTISLTVLSCKIMERIRDVMMVHLFNGSLIAPEQHGFVLNKFTITNLLETVDRISEGIDNGWSVLAVFLDFAKAFDKVCHAKLCAKIAAYGFDESMVNWISDFLSDPKQRVTIGQDVADWKDVTSGVPQGSILGPLLFLSYTSMTCQTNHIIKMFADDSKLIATIHSATDLEVLQRDLDALSDWSTAWSMMFNVEKCKVMEFSKSGHSKFSSTELSMGKSRSVLNFTNSEKVLGVAFSSNLKLSSHIKAQANKAVSILGQLRRTFRFWTKTTFRTLYCAYVIPHLEYVVVVWSPHTIKDCNILEKVQRRATKLVPRLRNETYSHRLSVLKLTTLTERRRRGDMIMFYKTINDINIVEWIKSHLLCNSLLQSGPA